MPKIAAEKPELIIISAGFDAHIRDPLASIEMQAADFGVLTTLIRQMAEEVAEGVSSRCSRAAMIWMGYAHH